MVRKLAFGLLLLGIPAVLSTPASAQIGMDVSVSIGPPALPVYEQPMGPGSGYLWTPGYWAWDDDDGYYWVPGTWVLAPVGMLWTPGYWSWNNDTYIWNAGYWGTHIGFYGGINYGHGYGGVGFFGGEWRGGAFYYNTAVTHVDPARITNVYVNRTVIVNNRSHAAFNGGPGGVAAHPTPQEAAFASEPHQPPLAAQTAHEHAASQNHALFASVNHGRPAVAATVKPGKFSGPGVVAAKAAGARYHAPAISPREARTSATAGNHLVTPNGENAVNHPFTSANKSNTSNSNRPEHTNNGAKQPARQASKSHSHNTPRPAHKPSHSTPKPSHSALKPSHSAPKPSHTTPKLSHNAPTRSHTTPQPTHSAPTPSHTAPPKHE